MLFSIRYMDNLLILWNLTHEPNNADDILFGFLFRNCLKYHTKPLSNNEICNRMVVNNKNGAPDYGRKEADGEQCRSSSSSDRSLLVDDEKFNLQDDSQDRETVNRRL